MNDLTPRNRGKFLIQTAFAFAKAYPVLLLFPFIANLFNAAFTALVITPYVHHETFETLLKHPTAGAYALFFVIYLLLTFVVRYCHTLSAGASLSCFLPYLNDHRKQGLAYGLKHLAKRFYALYNWTSFVSTAGIILMFTHQHTQKSKKISTWLNGIRWPFAGFFGIPLILEKSQWPISALKASSHLLKHTWGAGVVPRFGVVFYFFWLRTIAVIPFILGAVHGTKSAFLTGFIITAFLIFIISTISQMTNNVIHAVLYRYAKTQHVTPPFDESFLKQCFIQFTRD